MNPNRKLAAILFTDIVGYTAMMGNDESLAVTAASRHKAVMNQQVAESGGELIQFYGDGSLSIYPSATAALEYIFWGRRAPKEVLEEALAILDYHLKKRASEYVPAFMIATIYMGLEDHAKALEWLELEYEEGGLVLVFGGLKNDPKFKEIRGEKRFQALL